MMKLTDLSKSLGDKMLGNTGMLINANYIESKHQSILIHYNNVKVKCLMVVGASAVVRLLLLLLW